jgi:hypothetical protein
VATRVLDASSTISGRTRTYDRMDVERGEGRSRRAAGLPAYVTVIVPFIVVWMLQWYRKVPAVLKTRLNESPAAIVPESHLPVLEVDVCPTAPVFTHRTRVPFEMVIAFGEKAKSTIFTFFVWTVERARWRLAGCAKLPRADAISLVHPRISPAASNSAPHRSHLLRMPCPLLSARILR